MTLHILSDLHIYGADDPLIEPLISVFSERAKPHDVIVLAGDIFDLFVGNKRTFTDRYQPLIQAMSKAAKNHVKFHYIEGNHDFLLKNVFLDVPNLELHSEEVVLEMNGKKFYIAHGDQVDQNDYGYRLLRGLLRSLPMRLLLSALPGTWIDAIGNSSSGASRRKRPTLAAGLDTSKVEYLRKTYRSFAAEKLTEGYDFIVLGHCHDLDEKSFRIGERFGQYINVGYPRSHHSYLTWSAGESKIQRERFGAST
jgi:UDP-2,3-diacylglucosamine hydrolase